MMSTELPDLTPTVEVRWPKPGVAVVALGGEHDLDSAPEVALAAEEALAAGSHVVVDLSSVEFIDSSIIKVFIHASRELQATGRRFSLVLGTSPSIERTLEICGVLPALNRVATLEAALADPEQAAVSVEPAPA
jgi:stage II sporulation protein AA (anti-sigma F factor antagonist)